MSTRSTRTRSSDRDTGFPEPFDSNSNTTLPHPDADLSPDACITHDESAGDISTRRRRLPRLHRHKSRKSGNATTSFLDTQTEILSNVLSLTLPDRSPDAAPVQECLTRSSSATYSSRDDAESQKGDDGTPPSSPDSVHSTLKRSTSLFSKWKR